MEWKREPRSKSTHIWSIHLQQRSPEYTMGKCIRKNPVLLPPIFLSCIGKNLVLPPVVCFQCVSFTTHTEHFTFGHRMYGLFSPQQQFSETPAGCPAIQLNSDAIYPETVSDSRGSGLSPTRLAPPPPQMPIASSRSSGYPQLLSNLATNWRFPRPPPQIQLIW